MKPLLAEAARRRLQCRPPELEGPGVLQAKVDFFEAVVSRNAVEAKRAFAVLDPNARSAARLTPAAQAKQLRDTVARPDTRRSVGAESACTRRR